MLESIETMAKRTQKEVLPGLENVQGEMEKIGKDNQDLRDTLENLPDGLDADLQQMITDTQNAGREEAKRDIERVKANDLKNMLKDAQDIKGETSEKLEINQNADSRLNRSKSPYAKANIESTREAIAENSRKGREIIESLRRGEEETENLIRRIESGL